jgi:uncharacterized protein YdbL (DUF1318 family)
MSRLVLPMKLLLAVLLAACVTVNVYFPAAAAQTAADQVIDQITRGAQPPAQPQGSNQGAGSNPDENRPQGATATSGKTPFAARDAEPSPALLALGAVLNALVPAAHAQGEANLDVNTPETRAIVASMAARYPQLTPYFTSGAIGFTADGHIDIRDANAIPLPERARVKTLVSEDNRDRDALYAEVAKANGHPEWKNDIQNTFARRWIAKAPAGTWYQEGGAWKQK